MICLSSPGDLTKVEGDARRGALSMRRLSASPSNFRVGKARRPGVFHRSAWRPDFGDGDVLTLIEKARRPSTPTKFRRWKEAAPGGLYPDDFREQLTQIKKMAAWNRSCP